MAQARNDGHVLLPVSAAAVDGTTVEEWSPPSSLALCPKGPTLIKDGTSQHFNAMISPLVGFSVKMALWYQ